MNDGRPYLVRDALRAMNAKDGARWRVWEAARQTYRRGVVALVNGHDCMRLATVALIGLVTGTPVPPVRLT